MKILIASECLRTGGAQVFALRLSKVLHERGHTVYFFYHYQDYIHYSLVKKIYPEVRLLFPEIPRPLDWVIRKIDRLFYKLNIDISIRHKLVINYIKRIFEKYQIEVVHSNMFQSDYVFAEALQAVNIPLVVTMHGSYESFLHMHMDKTEEGYLNFRGKLRKTVSRINAVAYLTEKNLKVFNHPDILSEDQYQHINLEKIYNGFKGQYDQPLQKKDLNMPRDHFVFGLVARGIPEKGWEIAIKAFKELNSEKATLILVGESKYVAGLRKKYHNFHNIIFYGQADNPLDVIHTFDVGLLPSYYGESLPNVIVEYLYCKKPVITTNVGESAKMITTDEKKVAGFIINERDPKLIQEELTKLMQLCMNDHSSIEKKSSLTTYCFQRFDMEKCVVKYERMYQMQRVKLNSKK